MAYDNIFIDGFDKYGTEVGLEIPILSTGEWTSSTFTYHTVGTKLGAGSTGTSIFLQGVNNTSVTKTLPGNYARLIGGFHYKRSASSNATNSIQFMDSSTVQFTLEFLSSGAITLWRGDKTTSLATSTQTIADNTTVCIEYDVTIHNSTGICKVWIDGVLTSLNLSSLDLGSTANNYANGFRFRNHGGSTGWTYMWIDHFYMMMFLTAGSADTPLLDNPFVETQMPVVDNHSDFTVDAKMIGQRYQKANDCFDATAANRLQVRKFTPDVSGTLSTLYVYPAATNAGAQLRGAVYADSGGSPGAMLSDGTTVTGLTASTVRDLPLATPVTVTAGTPLWLGFICTTGTAFWNRTGDTGNPDTQYRSSLTLTTLPNPFGSATSTTDYSWLIWGVVTGATDSVATLDESELGGDYNYVSSGTVGHYDDYQFGALATEPTTIHTVAVKACVAGSGGQTIDLQMRSGGTTGAGNTTGITPSASYTYKASYFATDPDTAAAWDPTDLGNATSGFEIKS